MQSVKADLVVVGAGGAGLRAAIAAAERDPRLSIALVSKVLPMRSHTVAAEGGAAAVTRGDDSLEAHFNDTVSGGDWLCDQDVVEFFVARCYPELVQLEHWGCPWSRQDDGSINTRFFGGMSVQRTWFAADRSGFHILHTLFQTSLKYPQIRRYDEYFCADLIVEDGAVRGVLAIDIASGEFLLIEAAAVVLATGGACRGEGAILVNKDGYRYLQDYGLGPVDPWPRVKAMELGPRDRLSQAFWHEHKKGRTLETPQGPAVHLDLRHLGAKKIRERLPLISEAAKTFMGVDTVKEPIPVCPAVHYTMGGIYTNVRCETPVAGLYAAGECASVGIHGANRLGSNSLVEIVVFGTVAGESAADYARSAHPARDLRSAAAASSEGFLSLLNNRGGERLATLRDEMRDAMEAGVGIYRTTEGLRATCQKLVQLRERFRRGVKLDDHARAFNTEWLGAIELGFMLEVAEAMAHSALARRESRGAHMRLDGYEQRDDENFLKHTLAHRAGDGVPRIEHQPVTITKSQPKARHYGGAGKQAVMT